LATSGIPSLSVTHEKRDCGGSAGPLPICGSAEYSHPARFSKNVRRDFARIREEIEEAILYYAKAELTGGEYAPKAKARLEKLYKALHNDTLIGIDKIYKRAKESLAIT
jgi:hypothetical protein